MEIRMVHCIRCILRCDTPIKRSIETCHFARTIQIAPSQVSIITPRGSGSEQIQTSLFDPSSKVQQKLGMHRHVRGFKMNTYSAVGISSLDSFKNAISSIFGGIRQICSFTYLGQDMSTAKNQNCLNWSVVVLVLMLRLFQIRLRQFDGK